MRYKAVLFDMDDTLLKSWEVKWEHHRMVAKRYYDVELTDERLAEHWGKPFQKLVEALYGTPEPTEKMMEKFVKHELEYLKVRHDAAPETLQALHKQGVLLGVVTAMLTGVAEDDMVREFPRDIDDMPKDYLAPMAGYIEAYKTGKNYFTYPASVEA